MRRFWTIALLVFLVTPAFAVRHVSAPKHPKHKKVRKLKFKKVFPAGLDSVLLENIAADKMRAWRYTDQDEMQAAIDRGELVPLDGLNVSGKLPENRRYARPATVEFARLLSREFHDAMGDSKHYAPLMINSAVRPMDVQIKLRKKLGCRWRACVAAPADGERASSHERGTTIDISRKLTKDQLRWLVMRLWFYKLSNRILVIEERACFHIFVIDGLDSVETIPVSIPTEVIDEQPSGTTPSDQQVPSDPSSPEAPWPDCLRTRDSGEPGNGPDARSYSLAGQGLFVP